MLETKDLVKIYKPKKGIPVKALDGVTLKLPDKGMVFLLGKSGSGKSTLLNVLGGLDNYNGGEIVIKGVSSKNFKQKHFDSYRNTYVGFIFQEYNVLDEFSVGANIALAIELQNRKAKDSEINEILKEVDLEGFGNRKPNELSGGQKQRVAIARALVKNPEIIMADEPTGALDSVTGKQVLDTLKKLSKKKLVIVVSHDRDFAESYADRIIELSDGKVISDVEVYNDETLEADTLNYNGNTIEVPNGYHITEEDRKAINDYIANLDNSLELSIKPKSSKKFKDTDTSNIKVHSGKEFKLIKSKLPLKNAFKIGAGALGYKKFRLVITVLLSCIAFGLFGLSDTFGAYNHIKTCTNSLTDSEVKYLSLAKSKKMGEGVDAYWRDYGYKLSDEELNEISKGVGSKMHGVYVPVDTDLDFEGQVNPEIKLTETDYNIYSTSFSGGFAEISDGLIKEMGFKLLAGNLPDGSKNEIAVSEYIFEVFKKANYFDGKTYTKTKDGGKKPVYQTVNSYEDLIGKTIKLANTAYTVTAIIDTNFDLERYNDLIVKKEHQTKAEKLLDMVLFSEFDFASSYSYTGIIMVGNGYIEKLVSLRPPMYEMTEGFLNIMGDKFDVSANYMARLNDIKNEKIIWLNGAKTTLGEKELIVTADSVYRWEEDDSPKTVVDGEELNNTAELSLVDFLKKQGELSAWEYVHNGEDQNTTGYKIVGLIDNTEENSKSAINNTIICSDKLFNKYTDGADKVYNFAVGTMPSGKDSVKEAVSYCYREDRPVRYQIQNSVTYELDSVNDALKIISKYFLWIGIGFALFAALMLANFIGISISYKKQEIGILRAIGSRSNDVFRIFFAESFIIAMINFILSAAGVFTVTILINYFIRSEAGILVTVLSFGIRQVALLLLVSVFVAFVASFIPVKRIAAKKPIDAIRNR